MNELFLLVLVKCGDIIGQRISERVVNNIDDMDSNKQHQVNEPGKIIHYLFYSTTFN